MARKWSDFPGRTDTAEMVRYYTGVDQWCNRQWQEGRLNVFRSLIAASKVGMDRGDMADLLSGVLDDPVFHATEYKAAGMRSALHSYYRLFEMRFYAHRTPYNA